jgi:hypothetical protein
MKPTKVIGLILFDMYAGVNEQLAPGRTRIAWLYNSGIWECDLSSIERVLNLHYSFDAIPPNSVAGQHGHHHVRQAHQWLHRYGKPRMTLFTPGAVAPESRPPCPA